MNNINLGELVKNINNFFQSENLFSLTNQFLKALISPELQDDLIFLKIILLLYSLIFIIGIIFFLLRSSYLETHYLWKLFEILSYKPYGARKYEADWKRIMAYLEKGTEDAYKIGIIEADNSIDIVLKRLNIQGKNIDERLNNTPEAQIANIADLRRAHDFRNNIVHDPSISVDYDKAKEILAVYEKTLKLLDLV